MTGDEMERAIEFILKNQAGFEARQAAFEEWHAAFKVEQEKTDEQIRALSERDQQTREFLDELTKIVARNSQQIERNAQQIERNSQQIERTSQQLSHLNNIVENMAEGQSRRKEEIDALFKLVGGLIERKNGKSESLSFARPPYNSTPHESI